MMILPYASEKGCNLIKSLTKNLRRALPVNIQTRMILYVTPFVVLNTVMGITSVKVHDG